MNSGDCIAAGDRWIPQAEYDHILARVPIVCVDLVLLSADQPPRIGLIERETYQGGRGWCLVGGAVLRNESLTEAVRRHLCATLGNDVRLNPATLDLVDIIEYFTEPGLGEFYDPRKHAVSLTYAGRCNGKIWIVESGEASGFAWFNQEELDNLEFGFNQGTIVKHYLARSAAKFRLGSSCSRCMRLRCAACFAQREDTGSFMGHQARVLPIAV
jgi:ADP-ribose pyrophosphatase YjhB (NUDIX family)